MHILRRKEKVQSETDFLSLDIIKGTILNAIIPENVSKVKLNGVDISNFIKPDRLVKIKINASGMYIVTDLNEGSGIDVNGRHIENPCEVRIKLKK